MNDTGDTFECACCGQVRPAHERIGTVAGEELCPDCYEVDGATVPAKALTPTGAVFAAAERAAAHGRAEEENERQLEA